jgi:uncharacterized protein YdeI (BOF family)
MVKILIASLLLAAQTHPSSSDKKDDDGIMMDDVTMEKSRAFSESQAESESESDISAPTGATADDNSVGMTYSKPAVASPVVLKDVETLLDKPKQYEGQRVSVQGEVTRKIDDNTFVLKSGGVVKNRIRVEVPESKGLTVEKKDELLVTGILRLDDRNAYLVADQINVRR